VDCVDCVDTSSCKVILARFAEGSGEAGTAIVANGLLGTEILVGERSVVRSPLDGDRLSDGMAD
jgi:hypothetical protein